MSDEVIQPRILLADDDFTPLYAVGRHDHSGPAGRNEQPVSVNDVASAPDEVHSLPRFTTILGDRDTWHTQIGNSAQNNNLG